MNESAQKKIDLLTEKIAEISKSLYEIDDAARQYAKEGNENAVLQLCGVFLRMKNAVLGVDARFAEYLSHAAETAGV